MAKLFLVVVLGALLVSIGPAYADDAASVGPGKCSAQDSSSCATPSASPFDTVVALHRDIASLSEVLSLLEWDEHVNLPPGSSSARGRQKAALASVLHERRTSPTLRDAISAAQADAKAYNALDEFQRATLRDAARDMQRATQVPTSLEREFAQLQSRCVETWASARRTDNFSAYAGPLADMFATVRRRAKFEMPDAAHVYDGMVESFERGMSSARLQEIFFSIEAQLQRILNRTLLAKKACTRTVHPALSDAEHWDVDKQERLGRDLAEAIGFDFSKGRMGKLEHALKRSPSRYGSVPVFQTT